MYLTISGVKTIKDFVIYQSFTVLSDDNLTQSLNFSK